MKDPLVHVFQRIIFRNWRKLIGLALLPNNRTGRDVAAIWHFDAHENNAGLNHTFLPHEGLEDEGLHADEGIIHDNGGSVDLHLVS